MEKELVMKVQVNRKNSVNVTNIDKIVQTERNTRIYLRSGYPKIIITKWTKDHILLRLVNAHAPLEEIKRLR